MIVIKYKEAFIGLVNWVWEVIDDDESPDLVMREQRHYFEREPKIISKKEALDIIKQNGLILAIQNEFGKVWDSKDRAYLEKWKGTQFIVSRFD